MRRARRWRVSRCKVNVIGPDSQQYTGVTDAQGNYTVSYNGRGAGTDSVQAITTLTGMLAFSNVVVVPWTGGTGPGFETQGWIGSPASNSVVSGQVPLI